MIKRPAVRVRSIRHILPETMTRIREIFVVFNSMLPFTAKRILWSGSFARECAQLHSDMDINIDTGTKEERAIALAAKRDNAQAWDSALQYLRQTLTDEFGLNVNVGFEFPSIADNPEKRGYSILEDCWYNDSDPRTLKKVVKQTYGALDENGNFVPGIDPYAEEAARFKLLLGDKMIDLDTDEETEHYRLGNSDILTK